MQCKQRGPSPTFYRVVMDRGFTPRDVQEPTRPARAVWVLVTPDARDEYFADPYAALVHAPNAVAWARTPDGTWRGTHPEGGTYTLRERQMHE